MVAPVIESLPEFGPIKVGVLQQYQNLWMQLSIKCLKRTHNACLFIVHPLCGCFSTCKETKHMPKPVFVRCCLSGFSAYGAERAKSQWGGCDTCFYPESWLKQKNLHLNGSCVVWECHPPGYSSFVVTEVDAFESNWEHWLSGEEKDVWERKVNKIKQINAS